MTPATKSIDKMLIDPAAPMELRKQMLQHLMSNGSKACSAIIESVLESHASKNGKALYEERIAKVEEILTPLEEGAVRPGTYLHVLDSPGAGAALQHRVEVVLPDGVSVYPVLAKPEAVGPLSRGDTVLLDAQARVVLARQPTSRHVGEEARLVREIDEHIVEVEIEHQGFRLFYSSAELSQGIETGAIQPGQNVIICSQRRIAFCGVPQTEGLAHYRFLDRGPVPDVVVERDIASPAPIISDLCDHVRREMVTPKLGRKYRLFRCSTGFLTGIPGSGKTLHVEGFAREMYEVCSEVTGLPIEELPPRILRLRASRILSKWYGEAERNVDAFFNEVEALCEERVIGADGREYELPVLVIAEEVDGLTRERGSGHDGVDDRVQTTILQRLDTTARKLRDSLVIILCTSNVPALLDPAFVRRAGGTIEHFGRLSRRVFEEVLEKHLRGIPFAAGTGESAHAACADLTAWLFGPNADAGVAELVYAGSTRPVTKYRRDLLNGALVERAVQQAAASACRLEQEGCEEPGLTTSLLASALAGQVQAVVDQLTEANAHHYLDVPRGSRVATVRHLATTNMTPAELERGA